MINFKILAYNDIGTIEYRILTELNSLVHEYLLTEDELVGYFAEKHNLLEEKVGEIIKSAKLKSLEGEDGKYLMPRDINGMYEWTDTVASREDSYAWYRSKVRLSGPFAIARGIVDTARVMRGQNPFGMDIFNWMLPQTPVVLKEDPVELEIGGQLIKIPRLSATKVMVNGEERPYDVFNSNDYLGLRVHPRVMAASIAAVLTFGNGTGGSRMISGTTPVHIELERVISEFKGTEDTVVLNTGYATNVAMAATFFGPGSVIFSDSLNHASIIDGMKESQARIVVFKHNDIDDLVEKIGQTVKNSPEGRKILRQAFLYVESVYSMDGDIAKLNEIVQVAKHYGLVLGIDEAHSTLVLGKTGRGICERLNIDVNDIDLLMGTLSKAGGAEGGFISAKRELVEAFKLLARPFWFSTAQTAASFAGAAESFRVIGDEAWRVEKLAEKSAKIRAELTEMGYDIGTSTTHIIPVIIGDQVKTAMLSAQLKAQGILAGAIFAPAVQKGKERIRLSISAEHSYKQIKDLLKVFEQARGMILGR